MGEIVLNKKVSVLYKSVWKYFDYSSAIDVRRERVYMETKRSFYRLIWVTIVSVSGNHKGIIFG